MVRSDGPGRWWSPGPCSAACLDDEVGVDALVLRADGSGGSGSAWPRFGRVVDAEKRDAVTFPPSGVIVDPFGYALLASYGAGG